MAASRSSLPAVYLYRSYITSGGLVSNGPDLIDQYRRAADGLHAVPHRLRLIASSTVSIATSR